MKTGMKVQMGGLLERLKQFPQEIARDQESVLKQEARALTIRYAQCTLPAYGLAFDVVRAEGMKRRVESEVRRSYLTKDRDLYDVIKRRSPRLAAAYSRIKNDRKMSEAARVKALDRIRRSVGVMAGQLDPEVLKAARTGPGASVPKGFKATDMVSEPQLRAFARKQASLVGFAQAGWYAAARGLGGRVRRNRVSASGKRSTSEAFPAYVRKLANRYPGIGGARVLTTGSKSRVEIWTSVKHGAYALPDNLKDLADQEARESVTMALRESIRYLNKKRFSLSA